MFATLVMLTFVAPNMSFGESLKQEAMTTLNELRYTVSIGGDNLTRLAGRFGVSPGSLLKANPVLAARTNPSKRYWLYLGETLVIPAYQAVTKNLDEIGDATIVAVPMRTIREKDAEILRTQNNVALLAQDMGKQAEELRGALERERELKSELATLRERNGGFVVVITVLLLAIFLLVIALQNKKNNGMIDPLPIVWNEQKKPQELVSPSPETSRVHGMAEELDEVAKGLSINEVARFADMEILRDECGNSVTIKKLPEFFAKRPHLVGLTLEQCQERMLAEQILARKGGQEKPNPTLQSNQVPNTQS